MPVTCETIACCVADATSTDILTLILEKDDGQILLGELTENMDEQK